MQGNGRINATEPPPPAGIAPSIADYLQSMELYPNRKPLLDALEGGSKQEQRDAFRAWQILGRAPKDARLRPWWIGFYRVGKVLYDGRITASMPALLQIPQACRGEALMPSKAYAHWGWGEVDYAGSHVNILRCLTGQDPLQDPYEPVQQAVMLYLGRHVPRKVIKSMVLPVIYGRTPYWFGKELQRQGIAWKDAAYILGLIRQHIPEAPPGEVLQIEATLLSFVLDRLREAKMPAPLPIYDGVLTCAPEHVKSIMEACSGEVLGKPIPTGPLRMYAPRFI